jgi:hypothetical protein
VLQTTVGIPILIVLLRIITGLAAYTRVGQPPESIQSGYYGSPPNVWWWLKQSVIYFLGLFGMKLCVLIIFLMIPGIAQVGDWALSWTDGNEKLQIAFAMMIFPLIMNALQYYIIDSFIKKKEAEHEPVPSEDGEDTRRLYDDPADEAGSDSDSSERRQQRMKLQNRVRSSVSEEYDPDVDGDAGTFVGSSSSQRNKTGQRVPPELFPKE